MPRKQLFTKTPDQASKQLKIVTASQENINLSKDMKNAGLLMDQNDSQKLSLGSKLDQNLSGISHNLFQTVPAHEYEQLPNNIDLNQQYKDQQKVQYLGDKPGQPQYRRRSNSRVRKGQPIKDFIKHMDKFELNAAVEPVDLLQFSKDSLNGPQQRSGDQAGSQSGTNKTSAKPTARQQAKKQPSPTYPPHQRLVFSEDHATTEAVESVSPHSHKPSRRAEAKPGATGSGPVPAMNCSGRSIPLHIQSRKLTGSQLMPILELGKEVTAEGVQQRLQFDGARPLAKEEAMEVKKEAIRVEVGKQVATGNLNLNVGFNQVENSLHTVVQNSDRNSELTFERHPVVAGPGAGGHQTTTQRDSSLNRRLTPRGIQHDSLQNSTTLGGPALGLKEESFIKVLEQNSSSQLVNRRQSAEGQAEPGGRPTVPGFCGSKSPLVEVVNETKIFSTSMAASKMNLDLMGGEHPDAQAEGGMAGQVQVQIQMHPYSEDRLLEEAASPGGRNRWDRGGGGPAGPSTRGGIRLKKPAECSSLGTQKQNSKKLSQVVSESLFDCRDIGTSPIGELDQLTGEQPAMLIVQHSSGPGVGVSGSKDYKPIQQVNVQLMNQQTPKLLSSRFEPDLSPAEELQLLAEHGSAQLGSPPGRPQGSDGKPSLAARSGNTSTMRSPSGTSKQIIPTNALRTRIPSQFKINKQSHRYQRIILKSPNPNDEKKIVLGGTIELEADTLLNGTIYTDKYKQRAYSPEHQRQLVATQIMRQTEMVPLDKHFGLQGTHFDASDGAVKSQFEQISHSSTIRKSTLFTPLQKRTLIKQMQEQLKKVSVDKLEAIYLFLCQQEPEELSQPLERRKSKSREVSEFSSQQASLHLKSQMRPKDWVAANLTQDATTLLSQVQAKFRQQDVLRNSRFISKMSEMLNSSTDEERKGEHSVPEASRIGTPAQQEATAGHDNTIFNVRFIHHKDFAAHCAEKKQFHSNTIKHSLVEESQGRAQRDCSRQQTSYGGQPSELSDHRARRRPLEKDAAHLPNKETPEVLVLASRQHGPINGQPRERECGGQKYLTVKQAISQLNGTGAGQHCGMPFDEQIDQQTVYLQDRAGGSYVRARRQQSTDHGSFKRSQHPENPTMRILLNNDARSAPKSEHQHSRQGRVPGHSRIPTPLQEEILLRQHEEAQNQWSRPWPLQAKLPVCQAASAQGRPRARHESLKVQLKNS